MNIHKVPAQALISCQSRTRKCEKSNFGKVKVRLEIALAPATIAGGR
jgi:hypothetical protein